MVLALSASPHKTGAMSLTPPLSWAPTNKFETCPQDPTASGGMQARGPLSAGGTSLNAHQGVIPSPGAKSMDVSSKLGHLSEFMASFMARAMVDTVLTESLCGNDCIQWMSRDGCYFNIICKVING